MKKIINLKSVITILLSIAIVAITTTTFATDPNLVLGDGNQTPSTISGNEYENAQTPTVENEVKNDITNNTTNNTTNKAKTYNTVDEDETKMPKTGIEDYGVGILLVIGITSAIYAYKKIKDYRNI